MEWKRATQQENATVIPKSWIHIHYYEALNTLFRIENTLRVFVYIILKNQFFEAWSDINITSDDSESATIKSIAKKRIHQAQDFGYLGYGINCPVMHLTSGELIRIITHEAYWPYFRPYFPASKQVIQSKLDEIGVIRNSLAHFRPIKSDDIELIKQNARHALSGVEECLRQVASCWNAVPTNTQEQWYRELVTLGTELCTLRLTQSDNEQWIKLALSHKSLILATTEFSPKYLAYDILNLSSPSILLKYGNLSKYATYLSESGISHSPPTPNFSKTIDLAFSRKVIQDNHAKVKADLEALLYVIAEETELIRNDNLARGQLISAARVYAYVVTSEGIDSWRLNPGKTISPVTREDPPEYWGNIWLGFSLLTHSPNYPWMPVKVSEFDWE